MVLTPFSPPPGLNSDDTTFSAEGGWADADGFRFVLGKPETIEAHGTINQLLSLTSVTKLLLYKVSGTTKIAAAGSALSSVTMGDRPRHGHHTRQRDQGADEGHRRPRPGGGLVD